MDHHRPDDRLVAVRDGAPTCGRTTRVADYGVSRTEFELWVVGVLGTIFLLGCLFYYAGTKTRSQMVDVPLEGHEAEAADALVSAD